MLIEIGRRSVELYSLHNFFINVRTMPYNFLLEMHGKFDAYHVKAPKSKFFHPD